MDAAGLFAVFALVIAGRVPAGTEVAAAIDPVPLVLIVAGVCTVGYVTDPSFRLVQRATGDRPRRWSASTRCR
ncbi:MAG TPA: hypothetical protein HA263_02435 [Methanoregulaceae archaeon]|nr:hypothetical protein [Methanoregulaceae archaeon]